MRTPHRRVRVKLVRPKIDEIATICPASHMPVRGALHELEREGILELSPHRRAVIRPVDAYFVRNTYDLRAAIEGMLTERCAERIDAAGLTELRAHVDAFEDACVAADPLELVRANRELHDSINRHADNADAVRVLGLGRLLVEALRVRFGFGPRRTDAILREHRQILKAIASHDIEKAGRLCARALRSCERRFADATVAQAHAAIAKCPSASQQWQPPVTQSHSKDTPCASQPYSCPPWRFHSASRQRRRPNGR